MAARTRIRLMADLPGGDEARLVAEARAFATDEAFDALIDWTNQHIGLGIRRTGEREAVTATGSRIILEVRS